MNWVNITSGNGHMHQDIKWTNADLLSSRPLETKLQWNWNQNTIIFIQENPLEHSERKMSTILFLTQNVNLLCDVNTVKSLI